MGFASQFAIQETPVANQYQFGFTKIANYIYIFFNFYIFKHCISLYCDCEGVEGRLVTELPSADTVLLLLWCLSV